VMAELTEALSRIEVGLKSLGRDSLGSPGPARGPGRTSWDRDAAARSPPGTQHDRGGAFHRVRIGEQLPRGGVLPGRHRVRRGWAPPGRSCSVPASVTCWSGTSRWTRSRCRRAWWISPGAAVHARRHGDGARSGPPDGLRRRRQVRA
jgi:hypothetical protein